MTDQQDDSALVADRIRQELSLGAAVSRYASGSLPVFAVDDHVIKLFPAKAGSHFETEKAALARIDGKLSIPTPRLLAAGERDDWLYVVMSRLRGQSLAEAWPVLSSDDRHRLLHDVGTGLSELHATATSDLPALAVDWPQFLRDQRESCRARQAAKGLDALWLEQIDDYLERWVPCDDGRRVLLHTEVMREHLLVDELDGHWQLTGLVDFEPAMVGAPEYELTAVPIFVACGEPGLLGMAFDGYGIQRDETLPFRLMAYALLHRYSNLRWYLERLSSGGNTTLESLARHWFTP
jgi:hygromycin-B 7''-O-kinase